MQSVFRCRVFWMRFMLLASAMLLHLSGSAWAENSDEALAAELILSEMTLEEKVCQLFFITPEPIAHMKSVTKMTGQFRSRLLEYPVGGIILFPVNIQSGHQLTSLLQDMQTVAKEKHGISLLLGVDEEGGGVARVANKLKLKAKTAAASTIGETGEPDAAFDAGKQIGQYLSAYGFNLDFAPVADVRNTLDDTEIKSRAFSDDPTLTAKMVASFVKGLQGEGVLAVLKHFPGHGSAVGNAHDGRSISTRTVKHWEASEWIPFQAGLDAGARVVLMSHLTAAVVDNKHPASLSPVIVTELLRGQLGFDGVVVTDALRMNAITDAYSSGEACVLALEAGVDMLLLPKNFTNAYDGVLDAVKSGRLSEARIDESVRRILLLKMEQGLILGASKGRRASNGIFEYFLK